jgi:amino acid transporter
MMGDERLSEERAQPGGDGNPPATQPTELVWDALTASQRPAGGTVRIARHRLAGRRLGRGLVVLHPDVTGPKEGVSHAFFQMKHLLIGSPLATAAVNSERLNKIRALAIFSSDALSSVAYATEESMKVLILAGLGALSLSLPISISVALLLAIVATSYRQTILAYPNGGGSYIVASDNLGRIPGLVAAASLMIDYVLTVAVSVAAGVDAITSAFPPLLPFHVGIAILATVLLTLGNLRGRRESGTIFAIPTYVFIVSLYGLIAYGVAHLLLGDISYTADVPAPAPSRSLGLLLILAAFAQGCSAMTGTEAISNGVPAFEEPAPQNARATLTWMAVVLGTLFLGVSILATHLNVIPNNQETVISQIARAVVGKGPYYYLIQFSTAAILFLAANTSFQGFPLLSSIVARDGYMPHQFSFRGDRLAYSNGVMALALLALLLLVIFRGSVDALIGLYAIGVFVSFTLSQTGMVLHWLRKRGATWRRSIAVNATGAAMTAIVSVVIAWTKFPEGSWVVLIVTPCLVALFLLIKRHYQLVAEQTTPETPIDRAAIRVHAIVPVGAINLPSQQALAFACAVAAQVTGVHVTDDLAEARALQAEWEEKIDDDADLVIIESPYRSLVGPLLAYLDTVRRENPADTVLVVLPELVPSRWWENLLHNQTAFVLKAALLFHSGIIVADVPYHIRRTRRERVDTNPPNARGVIGS